MIAFQQDSSAEVRKCVIGFMEEAWYELLFLITLLIHLVCSKKDSGSLSKVVPILRYTMTDENVNILKRVLICVNQLYRLTLEVSRDLLSSLSLSVIITIPLIVFIDSQVIH